MKGPLDVLNAAQYGDGGAYMGGSGHGPHKPENHVLSAAVNPKKRGRKASQNDRAEYGEENKRARGRPRLETGDQHDMKAVSLEIGISVWPLSLVGLQSHTCPSDGLWSQRG